MCDDESKSVKLSFPPLPALPRRNLEARGINPYLPLQVPCDLCDFFLKHWVIATSTSATRRSSSNVFVSSRLHAFEGNK